MSFQNCASDCGDQRQANVKPRGRSGRPAFAASSRAATIPCTSASTTPLYAPSDVLGEIGRLPSLVIDRAATAGLGAGARTAGRTYAVQPAMSPSWPGPGW